MPIYEYNCTKCHHCFDVLQKISDEPVSLCPNCSNNSAVRLVSAAGFQLKGTGWYETDFKNKPKKANDISTPTPTPPKNTETKSESSTT